MVIDQLTVFGPLIGTQRTPFVIKTVIKRYELGIPSQNFIRNLNTKYEWRCPKYSYWFFNLQGINGGVYFGSILHVYE